MRILHVIHDFLPRHRAGSEIYVFELCHELGRRHHVSILCADYDPSRPHGHLTWRLQEGLPVIEMANNWVCASFEDTYRSPLIGDRIQHVLRAVQPEVIHVHNLLTLSFELPALAQAHGIPVVATLHDYALVCPSGGQRVHRAAEHSCEVIDPGRCVRCFRESPLQAQMSFGSLAAVTKGSGALYRAASAALHRFPPLAAGLRQAVRSTPAVKLGVEDIDRRLSAARRLFDQIDLFVAPSASMAGEFRRLGLDEAKIRVSDYGLVPLRPVHRNGDGSASGGLRIGYVGTVVWHKGVHVLIEALRELPAGAYDLQIFGSLDVSPDYVVELRRKAAGFPVAFQGSFDRERAPHVYSQLDVLVVPSIWIENSPLVIHEAFMAGVPVVAARAGGIPELVDHGRTGLLYDPSSPSELAAALIRLIETPELLRQMRAHVLARPIKPIARDAEEWERAYVEVVGRRAVT